MIAHISLMRRQDSVSLNRFRRHWLDVHGPLVCSFAGLRRYAQAHPVQSPAMNDAARALRIDGFPILFFDNDADRSLAHGSPEMAACNIDSKLFVGAVARVITDAEAIRPMPDAPGRFGLLSLFPEGTGEPVVVAHTARLAALPRLEGLTRYRVREQGPAPASTVPHLAAPVAAIAHARFASLVDLESALDGWETDEAARFVVEEHWLV